MELSFTTGDVRFSPPEAILPGPLTLKLNEHEVRFRLPNSEDLVALPSGGEANVVKSLLLARCVLEARHNGKPVSSDQLPAVVSGALSERLAEADPQADVQLAMICPQCACHWQTPLDILSFLWTEVHTWAVRLLRDVHTLASAYGWREADILTMTPWRRAAYLELIGP